MASFAVRARTKIAIAAALAIVAAVLAVAAVAEFGSVTVKSSGETVACGSLFSPETDLTSNDDLACSGRLLDRQMERALVLIAGSAIICIVVMIAARQWRPKELRLVDGNTTVRSARPTDSKTIGSTIDSVVIDHMGWPPEYRDQWRGGVQQGRRSGILIITESTSDMPIGVVTAWRDITTDNGVRLGMWMGPSHRRQGHMSRAIALVSNHFVNQGKSLAAESATTNRAAQSIFLAAGFDVVGSRKVRLPNGSEIDGVIYMRYPSTPATVSPGGPPPKTGNP